MPKTKKPAVPAKKRKLSKEERSQIAKARWAKIRADKEVPQDAVMGTDVSTFSAPTTVIMTTDGPITMSSAVTLSTPVPAPQPPEQPPVTPESIAPGMSGEPINVEPFRPAPSMNAVPYVPDAPAPQLAPVVSKKQKRYTGPKEFSVALKAAESRLAKAIVERAEYGGKMAALQAEIPSLVQIINALKGPQNISVAPYDFAATGMPGIPYPPAPPFQSYVDPLAAIQAGQNIASAPVSRAQGGAIQFGPDVIGSLEGPEDDDDPDKYITGPLAGGGWK